MFDFCSRDFDTNMTLFSIENLARSDCKSYRCNPEVTCQLEAGIYPSLPDVNQSTTRPSSTESSVGAASPATSESGNEGSSEALSTADGDTSPHSTKKPPHSYIALIAMAIIDSPEKRLLLCDIYEFIMKRYPFFKDNERSWRNSIRHNLSLNECFIKVGRSGDGRGHFWAIHPANIEDFARGDYRRRQARRRVRAASYSPYAYPANITAAHQYPTPGGFLAVPYPNVSDVIPKAHYHPMLPGMTPFGLPYHTGSPHILPPTPLPISHPLFTPPTTIIRPDVAGRTAVTAATNNPAYPAAMTSIATASSPARGIDEQASRIVQRLSPTNIYPISPKSSLPSTVHPSSSAWIPKSAC